jgi:hypothetical protein
MCFCTFFTLLRNPVSHIQLYTETYIQVHVDFISISKNTQYISYPVFLGQQSTVTLVVCLLLNISVKIRLRAVKEKRSQCISLAPYYMICFGPWALDKRPEKKRKKNRTNAKISSLDRPRESFCQYNTRGPVATRWPPQSSSKSCTATVPLCSRFAFVHRGARLAPCLGHG